MQGVGSPTDAQPRGWNPTATDNASQRNSVRLALVPLFNKTPLNLRNYNYLPTFHKLVVIGCLFNTL